MAGIQFHLLAILTLASTVVLSSSVNLLNDIPVNTIMDEGTVFVLRWEWDGDATGVGQLDMSSFQIGDSNSSMDYRLEDKLNLTMGSYPWVVKPPQGRDTLDWYCSLGITYNDGFQSTSGRSFRIRARDNPSTTGGTTGTTTGATGNATSTTMMTSITNTDTIPSSTSTETSSPGQQMFGDHRTSNKLPGGTIAGIVVGVVAVVGIFAALVGLVVYYRRKATRGKKEVTPPDTSDPDADAIRSSEVNAETQHLKPELDAAGAEKVYYELDSTPVIPEVDAVSTPTELDSSARSELGDGHRELK